jgi:SAM-dependent methyltransferase
MSLVKEATFYDDHPFDWFEGYRGEERRKVISPLLLEVIDALPGDSLVLDVGCGPGRVLSYLGFRGVRCIGLDRSANSIAIIAGRHRLPGAVADNLHLPVLNDVADLVITDGVMHHTGDPPQAFAEDCRIVKPGGKLYVAVYRPGGRYEFIYRYPGWFVRLLLRSGATTWIAYATVLPLYYLAHKLKSKGKVTWQGARNLFYDYFASTHVAFLSKKDVEAMGAAHGMDLLRYDENLAQNVHCFEFRKNEA